MKTEDIEDASESGEQLGNYHIEVPKNMEYMIDQFNTFATKDSNGEPSKWLVTPKVVKDWIVRFGKARFSAGQDEAFDRVIGLLGSNMSRETREALTFLINENK